MILIRPPLALIPSTRLVPGRLLRQARHAIDPAARQIDIDAPLVLLRRILQPHLATHLLHARRDLAHAARRVVALADDDVQVRLPPGLRVADARLQDVLRFFDVQPVQVDGVGCHAVGVVAFPENELRCLLVEGVPLRFVLLAEVGEVLGFGAVAAFVGLVGLWRGLVKVGVKRSDERPLGEMR